MLRSNRGMAENLSGVLRLPWKTAFPTLTLEAQGLQRGVFACVMSLSHSQIDSKQLKSVDSPVMKKDVGETLRQPHHKT